MIESYSQLVRLLITNKLTVATAESCTGGLVAKLITDIPGSSQVFIGGVVCYSNNMKSYWLGVKKETLEKFGAVSEATIKEMLIGIRSVTQADINIAISGIAGPAGGTIEKPVGTVVIGLSYRTQIDIKTHKFEGSRKEVRQKSAEEVLYSLRLLLK
jgi:PncC family amidohydrolase